MRNRIATLAFGGLTLALMSSTGTFAQDAQTGGTLRVLGTAEVDRFDTVPPATADTGSFFRATTRQLINFAASEDPQEQIAPQADLAETVPTATDDGLTYTFTLREGANWDAPDGPRQIVADDVERGFKRLCNPFIAAPAVAYFEDLIVGFADYCAGFAEVEPTVEAMKSYIEDTDIEGIETPSDDTVVFRLNYAANDFIYLLTLPVTTPAPVEVLDYLPDSPEYRDNYISNGPYTIESYVPDTQVTLTRNPAWEAESDPLRNAYVDSIEIIAGVQPDAAMQQLQSGDGDMLYDINVPPVTVQMLSMQGDEKISTLAEGASRMIWINTVSENNDGALRDPLVRQALNYAVDKAAVVQQVGGPEFATPLNGIFPLGILGHHEFDPYPTPDNQGDPERARELLAEAGYPDGLSLKMPFRNAGNGAAEAQVLQASLEEAGFDIELVPTPASDFYPRLITNFDNALNGVWDLVPSGWSPDWPGGAARSIFQPQYTYDGTHGTFNFSDYNNEEANEIADQALSTTDLAEAEKLWNQVDEIVMADPPTVPLISQTTVLYHGDRVENFLPYAAGGNGDWTNVWLNR
ncbi:ABC transporter substrate-binding protein [Devosia pacifica]|uniref:ABC transporter substrate-binding protein n=1 Tax=Devosia pacifica TaxID=1335967 RepID=A0A918SD98_9HYPH|nr:ABC transporter substrate-binding protein [Devosia pacifica]GHA33065.1 ABC transporter substrate-binding protein [Devosia pacifica]